MPKASQRQKPTPKKSSTKKKVPASAATQPSLKLPNVMRLAQTSWSVIWRNRKTFALIVLIYGLAYLVLVLGLSSPANVSSLKQEFGSVFHGHLSHFYAGLSIVAYLVGSTTTASNPGGSAYQVIILILASLSIIWALRQFYLGASIRARDSYYQGLYPLAPYLLVLLFIFVELIPLIIGLGLYAILIEGGIAVSIIEKVLSIALVILLIGASFYLISSSVIALYIATLPNMTPLKALRSAKGLVKGRRWQVLRKIIFLPLLLFISIGILMLPFIFLVPGIAAWIFFLLTLFALVYIHSYLYSLYRGLINE